MTEQEYFNEEMERDMNPFSAENIEKKLDELEISDVHKDLCRAAALAVADDVIEKASIELTEIRTFKVKKTAKGNLAMDVDTKQRRSAMAVMVVAG